MAPIYKVALVDDHTLFRELLKKSINNFPSFEVIFDAGNGVDFKKMFASHLLPDLVIVDLHLPVENGFELLAWMKSSYPRIKVIILSVNAADAIIIKAFRAGANGYFVKTIEYESFRKLLLQVINGEHVFPGDVFAEDLKAANETATASVTPILSATEINFIRYLASEMSYKEIGEALHLSSRTMEDYKRSLCVKFGVKTRIGLVVEGIKMGIVLINQPN